MANNLIDEINKYSSFRFDENCNRVINLKSKEDTNVDEFLNIQHMLDNNNILHKFENNFEIQILK